MNTQVAQERKVSVPVILDFVPTSCSIQLNQYPDNSVAPSIDMGLRLSGRDNVSATDGHSLNNIEWSIRVYRGPTSNDRIKSLDAIGLLNYFPAAKDDYQTEAGCSAWAHIEAESFNLLQTFVMSGRLPSYLRVHAEGGGLRYGYAPDGSEKVWDVKPEVMRSMDSNDWVAVKQLEIGLRIGDVAKDEDLASPHRPVSADDLHTLQESIQAGFASYLSPIKLWLSWILAVTAAIAVIVLFATWGR